MKHLIEKIYSGILPDSKSLNTEEKKWYEKVFEFKFDGIIQDHVEEYIFHSPQNVQLKLYGISLADRIDYTQEEFDIALFIMCLKNEIKWNISNPFVSFDYQNYRATLVHSNCLNNLGHKLFLRTKIETKLKPSDFNFSNSQANRIIGNKKNILIAGSTGSGKTTFLNSLLEYVECDEHIIITEDTFEIKSPNENCTRFLSQDINGYSLDSYLSYAMRMRPDRILVGELRSREVISFLLALNTGHKGLMSTIHANDARDAIKRIALLYKLYCPKDIPYETILKLVTQNVDEIVYLKDKKVIEHVSILGSSKDEVFLEEVLNSKEPLQH